MQCTLGGSGYELGQAQGQSGSPSQRTKKVRLAQLKER
jgi:hypothetical protein